MAAMGGGRVGVPPLPTLPTLLIYKKQLPLFIYHFLHPLYYPLPPKHHNFSFRTWVLDIADLI
jgi:hypothetical protein